MLRAMGQVAMLVSVLVALSLMGVAGCQHKAGTSVAQGSPSGEVAPGQPGQPGQAGQAQRDLKLPGIYEGFSEAVQSPCTATVTVRNEQFTLVVEGLGSSEKVTASFPSSQVTQKLTAAAQNGVVNGGVTLAGEHSKLTMNFSGNRLTDAFIYREGEEVTACNLLSKTTVDQD